MRYLSLFSGIEAASAAWHPLGWECAAVSETDPFPCAVLANHYPSTPNLGDITEITEEQVAALGPLDLVVGGSPCQDLSVAGLRAGLAGARSGLFFDQLRVFEYARKHCGARFLLWENVPGAFSSHKGQDFARVVGEMAGTDFPVPTGKWQKAGMAVGPNGLVEWRTLDAQYVRVQSHPRAVPQRRRRVFALLDTGNWSDRPPILLERESLSGDPPPRRGKGAGVAAITASGVGTCGADDNQDQPGHLIPQAFGGNNTQGAISVGTAVNVCSSASGRLDFESKTFLVTPALDASYGRLHGCSNQDLNTGHAMLVPCAFHGSQDPDISGDVTHPVGRNQGLETCVAFAENSRAEVRLEGGDGAIAGSLSAGGGKPGQGQPSTTDGLAVRRLTPRECERLQGFPDDYTLTPYRTKPAEKCPDGPRYKALGNSMAVNVMGWIGVRVSQAVALEAYHTLAREDVEG